MHTTLRIYFIFINPITLTLKTPELNPSKERCITEFLNFNTFRKKSISHRLFLQI